MGRSASRIAGVVAVTCLALATSCTRSGEDLIELGPEGSPAGPAAPGDGGISDVDAALDRGDFGTLEAVCGPAPDGQENGPTGSQGVTADSIAIGTFADPGNQARPGLNQELFDTGRVFTEWCNDLGGINGRRIDLAEHDSGLFEYQARMVDACARDFALVGGGAVFDDAGQETRLRCLLPDIAGFRATPEALGADLSVGTTPVLLDAVAFGIGPYLTDEYPEATERVGVLTGNVGTTITQAASYGEAGEHFGWDIVYRDQYNAVGESTWVPYAQKIAESDVRGLLYVGEPANLGLLVQALQQIGHQLDWLLGTTNVYDAKLIESAGGALTDVPVYTWTGSVPFEAADRSPGLQAMQALFERYDPGGRAPTALALSSLSAWLLFAQAAKACGADLTRPCLLDNAERISAGWDGGGMSAPAGEACSAIVRATPDGFEVVERDTDEGVFTCDPDTVVQLREPIGRGVTLEDVGRSRDELS